MTIYTSPVPRNSFTQVFQLTGNLMLRHRPEVGSCLFLPVDSILISFSHLYLDITSGLVTFQFPTTIMYLFLIFTIRATCPYIPSSLT
jgi:hypothetical protein